MGLVLWVAHRRLFRAGGVPLLRYLGKMRVKRRNTVERALVTDARDPVEG